MRATKTALTFLTVFLLASELSLFRVFFARNWPLLGPSHGFVALALAMIVLGINMLGNLNKEATSQESLGLEFWRVVIASGILIFILGWLNLIAVRSTTRTHQAQPLTTPLELRLPQPQPKHHRPPSPRPRRSRRTQDSQANKQRPQHPFSARASPILHQQSHHTYQIKQPVPHPDIL